MRSPGASTLSHRTHVSSGSVPLSAALLPRKNAVQFELPGPVVNRLVASLPRPARERLLSQCDTVDLVFGMVLCEPQTPVRFAYFPLSGFISQVVSVSGHRPMEVALVGSEGMLGATLVLDIVEAPLRAVVQGAGTALRISTSKLRKLMGESAPLQSAARNCVYQMLTQVAQNIACTRFHEIDARLARWLLMTHDRAHADHFHLTHEYLAEMLGVQRGAVSIAAAILKKHRLIDYARGEISILSRRGLEAIACECYRVGASDSGRILR